MEFLIYVYVFIGFILLVGIFVGRSIIKEAKRSATLGGDPEKKRRWWWKKKRRKSKRHR